MSYNSNTFARPRMTGSPSTRSAAVSSLRGSQTDRLSRFQARSARRWGNWDVLAVPTALLWADAYDAALEVEAVDDLMDQEPDVVDLWP